MLIREAELELAPGLNAITGETGAGKTILAQAIGLLLGARGDASLVGAQGADAYVEAELHAPPEALEEDDPWRAFCDFMYRSTEMQANDRALSEAMASRSDEMHRAAVDSGLHALTEQLIARAQKSGGMRSDAVVEDVPAIICGLGRVTRASAGQKTISWERFLAILLDGLRARADCSRLPAP